MKKSIVTMLALLVTLLFSASAISDVTFLRGSQGLDEMSKNPAKKKQETAKGGFKRSYKIQPPMIPHKIDKETINLKTNTCMKCHSEKTYKKKKAPKAGDSHYINRDGKKQATVSARRYFCDQCHAPQVKADPLVQNNFVGAK